MFLATCTVFLFDRTNVEMDKEETFQSIFCRGKKRLMVYLSRKGISLKRTFILLVWGITNISLEKKKKKTKHFKQQLILAFVLIKS